MASKFLIEWPRTDRNVVFAIELPLVHERWTYVLLWFVSHENCYSTKYELHFKHLPKLFTSRSVIRDEYHCYYHGEFFDQNRF